MLQTDLDTVSELSVLANPHVEKRKYRSHIIDHLKLYPDLAFVAVHEGKVVGYVMGYTQDGKAWIDDIAVDINYQKKGIGKKLLKKELTCLKEKGAKIVIVEVHHEQSTAIPFYYKYGFRISGCMLDYFGLGHDAVILQRVL
jgi:ribosomal-protein-alanine N-acetyltransferase